MRPLARTLIRYRVLFLAVAVVVTLALLPVSLAATFDRSIRSFFDANNERYLIYNEVQRQFEGDTLCLAVYPDPELLTPAGMLRLDEFGKELGKRPGVRKVQSLATMPRPGGRPGTLAKHFSRPGAKIDELRDEILSTDVFRNQFISEDGKTAVAVILIDPDSIASGEFTRTLVSLREMCTARGGHIVGAPVMINDVYDYLEQDSWILTNVSTWAMVFVILGLFRRLRWMILPILVVQAALIWIKAMMYLTGIQLSLTGAMTTAMVTVVGITSAIHLAVRFREISDEYIDHEVALYETLIHVLPPIFWSWSTTAFGFGALAISQVAPVRSFGLVMAVASLAVFLAVFLIMPGGILLGRDLFGVVPRPSLGERHLSDTLHWAAAFVGRHAWLTTVVTMGALGVAAFGFQWLRVETDFTKNFKESSTIIQGYRFVESRLGGAGIVDIMVDAPSDMNSGFRDRMRSCQEKLRGIEGVAKVTSLIDMLDFMKASDRMIGLMRNLAPPEIRQFWNPKTGRARIVLRVREQQSTDGKERLLREINDTMKHEFGSTAEVTGLYVLLVYLIDSLLADQWTSLWISCAGILAMMGILFRSWRMALVAFLPNIIPIVVTIGMMGWLGLRINVATAMIQSISMGMAVDFSIHYLTRYRFERRCGVEFYPSLSATHRNTGQAMVFADGALILGFGILTLSHFLPTIQFGLLVSLAMVGGLIGNLIMLPVLLRVFYRIGPPRLAEEVVLDAQIKSKSSF